MASLFIGWLKREDGPDDAFLAEIADFSHSAWDHYTHLRLAWLLLKRHGEREFAFCVFVFLCVLCVFCIFCVFVLLCLCQIEIFTTEGGLVRECERWKK
jgi:hypothetical protein